MNVEVNQQRMNLIRSSYAVFDDWGVNFLMLIGCSFSWFTGYRQEYLYKVLGTPAKARYYFYVAQIGGES